MIDFVISKKIFRISLFMYNIGFILILPYILLGSVLAMRQIKKTGIKIAYIISMIVLNTVNFLLTYYLYFNDFININEFIRKFNGTGWMYNDLAFFSMYTCATCAINIIGMCIVIILCRDRQKKIKVTSYIPQLLILLIFIFEAGISISFYYHGIGKVRINEISSLNSGQYIVYYNETEYDDFDYVEIKNDGILSIELDEFYLSDKQNNLLKYHISDKILSPNEYLVVPLSKELEDEGMFGISSGGETVNFSYNGIWGIMEIDRINCPETEVNISWCRVNDANEWNYMECSPGSINSGSIVIMEKPVFSVESGFYDEAFYLDIQVPDGYNMAYTVDGSKPTMDSPIYTEPIYVYNRSNEDNVYRSVKNVVYDYNDYEPDLTKVDKAFVIRGFLYNDNGIGREFVKTYFVGLDREKYPNVVSIVVDPSLMWGENGIYVTGSEYDKWYEEGQQGEPPVANFEKDASNADDFSEYEIPANLSLYESNEMKMNQNIGLRIQGASSRWYALKRFKLYARKIYSGSSTFDIPLFDNKASHSVSLRYEYNGGKINALLNRLAQNRYTDAPESREVQVFVNGEFWYTTYMYERYDERYYSEKYGIDKNKVGTLKTYQSFADWYTDWDNVVSIWDIDMFDVQSFIDFYIFNMYYCNADINEGHNVAC